MKALYYLSLRWSESESFLNSSLSVTCESGVLVSVLLIRYNILNWYKYVKDVSDVIRDREEISQEFLSEVSWLSFKDILNDIEIEVMIDC